MILLPFVAGDAWTWSATLRYADAEGPVLEDRERWTVRVLREGRVEAERRFLGTVVDGRLVPFDGKPETTEGRIEEDGTLSLKGNWSDATATRALRRLLRPTPKDAVVAGLVRRATLREAEARLPGNDGRFALRVEVALEKARVGGKDVELPKDSGEGSPWSRGAGPSEVVKPSSRAEGETVGEGVPATSACFRGQAYAVQTPSPTVPPFVPQGEPS